MNRTPRLAAIELLAEWQRTAASVDLLVAKENKFDDPRDAGLLKAILYGVLRNYSLLNWIIAQYSKHPVKKIKPRVLHALQTGIFQLMFMDRIPPSAAVNETVNCLRKIGEPRWVTGFVNGLLRNVEREKITLRDKINSNTIPEHILLNHPEWLVKRWKKRYGQERLEEICSSNNNPASLCLRVNTLKINHDYLSDLFLKEGVACKKGQFVDEALWLSADTGAVDRLPGYENGYFSVQDEIAQLLCHLLGKLPEKGRFLDACAGLGGKTAVICQLALQGSLVWAVEPSQQRLKLLEENIDRLALPSVNIFPGALDKFASQTKEKFNAVLVDAPCSGLGVIGRHPDIRWQRTEKDLLRYQEKQLSLLNCAASLVLPGGVLVYATCSTEPEENDAVVDKFLQRNDDFKLEDAKSCLGESASCLVDDRGFLRTVPGKRTSDGFFGARLLKK